MLLAALAVASAATVTLAQVVRRAADTPHRLLLFVAFDGVHLLVFAGLVTAALLLRRRGDIHKRLMLFATVSLLPPAFGRITGYFTRQREPAHGAAAHGRGDSGVRRGGFAAAPPPASGGGRLRRAAHPLERRDAAGAAVLVTLGRSRPRRDRA